MLGIRGILLHISVICSLVCIAAKVLDYYNPYMDFSGHVAGLQILLYVGVVLLEATRQYQKRRPKSKKIHNTMLKKFNYV